MTPDNLSTFACPFCKTRFVKVASDRSPEQNFEKLAKECCGYCGSGCGRNVVFHKDYAPHVHQEWMESVRWAGAELTRLRARLALAEKVVEAARKRPNKFGPHYMIWMDEMDAALSKLEAP